MPVTDITRIDDAPKRIHELVDFVASCRVLGRGVENILLNAAVAFVRTSGPESLHANFRNSGRNSVCLQFLKKSGLVFDETGPSFRWIRGVTCLSRPDWIECLTVKSEAVTAAANCLKDLR
jgi:predicted enzyme involved in methoxymalonyl-ACP biosynthesis